MLYFIAACLSAISFFVLKSLFARLYNLENLIESMQGKIEKQCVELEVIRSKQIMSAPAHKPAHKNAKK
jgi:hypothetical protein